MDVRAHVVFMARMFLLLLIFLSNQLPLSYDFRIDADRFFSAFSFEVDGERECVGPWVNGPGYRAPAADADVEGAADLSGHDGTDLVAQASFRFEIKKRWHLHYNRLAAHIPYAVLHDKHYEVDETGALVHPGVAVSDRFDALGNPIEPGGRPYIKPTGPVTKAKGESSV